MTDLLDLLAEHDPRADLVHRCMPSMVYACGGNILGLADGGPGGRQVFGAELEVTCPDCLAAVAT